MNSVKYVHVNEMKAVKPQDITKKNISTILQIIL